MGIRLADWQPGVDCEIWIGRVCVILEYDSHYSVIQRADDTQLYHGASLDRAKSAAHVAGEFTNYSGEVYGMSY